MAATQAPSSSCTPKTSDTASDRNNFVPTFAELIRQCDGVASLKHVHSRIAASRLDTNTFLGNLLVDMYGRCGCPSAAAAAFDRISSRNVFSWTILIAAFARNGHFVHAMVTFHEMDQEGVRPNKVTYLAVADVCVGLGGAARALDLYDRILSSMDPDLVLATAMIVMLAKCGLPAASEAEFLANREEIDRQRCIIAWNAMLDAYARNGHRRECLELFHQIVELDPSLPDAVTIATALSACSDPEFLEMGKSIHARAIASNRMDRSTVVGNCIVRMYVQCQSLDDAMAAFEEIPAKSTVSWSIAMAALVQGGRFSDAEWLVWRMDQDGAKMDKIAFVAAVGAICGISNPSANCGRTLISNSTILERARAEGFHTDSFVGSAIVSALARSGCLEEARESFEEIADKRDIVVWNSLISALAKSRRSCEGVDLFHRLSLEGIAPNPATIASVFDAISTLDDDFRDDDQCRDALAMAIELERLIATRRIKSSSLLVQNSMIDAYGKLHSPGDARRIFDAMEIRSVVSWTAMIGAYARHGFHRQALLLFEQMDLDLALDRGGIQANHFTLSTIVASFAKLGAVEDIDKIHARARSMIHDDDLEAAAVVASALISSYGDCGCIEKSLQIFQEVGSKSATSCSTSSSIEEISVLGSYCKNTVVWNATIEALSKNDRPSDGIKLFHAMDQAGVMPSSATFASAIAACSKLGRVDQARGIYSRAAATSPSIDPSEKEEEHLTVAMIDLYGKSGFLLEAQQLFHATKKRSMKAWNAIIAANARSGHSRGVVETFHTMHLEGLEPKQATFSRLLESCCHAGMLDEAWESFIYMREDHGVAQAKRHWGSIVDALARAGSLSDATDVAAAMPFRPSIAVWKILLHACQIHGESSGADGAAREASRLRPGDAVPYVLLARMWSS